MARDEKEVVSAVRKVLADKVGFDRYILWFGRRARFAWDGASLTLHVDNAFCLNWIRTMFHEVIQQACENVLGQVPEIRYELCPEGQLQPDESAIAVVTERQKHRGRRVQRAPLATASRRPKRSANSSPGAPELPLFADHVENLGQSNDDAPASSDGKLIRHDPHPTKASVHLDIVAPADATAHRNNGSQPADCTLPESLLQRKAADTRQRSLPHCDGEGLSPDSSVNALAVRSEVAATSRSEMGLSPSGRSRGHKRRAEVNSAEALPAPQQHQDAPQAAETFVQDARRWLTFESFVVGDCNRLAFAAAETVSRSLGTYSPLFIYGPSGVGKTHLLEAIWQAVKRRQPQTAALYLSAEQFLTAYVEALKSNGVASFRQKYRGIQLFLLDDLQFLAGKRQTQIEFMYTIDSLLKNGCQVVCSADRPPGELCELAPELRSRLEGGVICRIDPPDITTRRAIVSLLCERLGIALSPDVQHWVAEVFPRSVRQLTGAVRRLEATNRALRRPIDQRLAAEILADMLPEANKPISLGDVEREVCRIFALPSGALQSDRKDRTVTYPRMLAMWLARKLTRANLSEIGRFFGKRSHATVIAAQKRVEQWLQSGDVPDLGNDGKRIREALQEIERRLRAS